MRIRRLKKQDTKGSRAANNDAHAKGNNRKTKQDEKIAYLFFTADIKTETNGCLELRVKSEPIYLSKSSHYYDSPWFVYDGFRDKVLSLLSKLVCSVFGCCDVIMSLVFLHTDANHDPPEIHRIIPAYGSSQGGEQIVIVGTRMHSREYNTLEW